MDCPFCGKEMEKGTIPSGTRWVRDNTWEGVPLGVGLLEKAPKSFFCPDCRQILLPVPDSEGVLELMERKLNATGNKIEEARKQWEARRSQAKKQKKKKEFGSKDPWEL